MKIDLLITELELGGAERCCTSLAVYLHLRKHSVRVISIGPRPQPIKGALVRQLETEGVPLHFLNGQGVASLPRVRSAMMALVRSDPPEVAQTFLWHANMLGAAVYPAYKIPIVGGVRVVEPRRWRAWLAPLWVKRMERIVCVSPEVAEWCQRVEHVPQEKLLVIPNGINAIDPEMQHDPRTNASDRILLFVGRMEWQKGVDGLLAVTDRLLVQLPEHRLVIIGDGPMRSEWERYQSTSRFGNRVDLLGRRDDVLDWMAHSELLVHPARYEGMPNVVLEAMASGIPTVAFEVEGVNSLLGGLAQQQSVAKEDWNAWVARVVAIANDTSLRASLGNANRARAQSEFRLDDQLAKYENLFHALTRRAS